MKVMKVYSIHDCKAEAFNQPFFSPNSQTAMRMFQMNVNEAGTMLNQNAGDYTLFEIGEFDLVEGKLTGKVPEAVCNALSIRKVEGN